MDIWGVVFAISLIIIITFIILLVADVFASSPDPISSACGVDSDCRAGLRCENGICKSPIGGSCATLQDCVSVAIACQNGICLAQPANGIGQPCPCQVDLVCQAGFCRGPTGATCTNTSDCMAGMYCVNGGCTGATGSPGGNTGCYYAYQEADLYMNEVEPYYQPSGYFISRQDSSSSDISSYDSYHQELSYDDYCLTSHECPTGYFCAPRIVYQKYRNEQMLPLISKRYFPGENAIDVAVHYDQIYILLEGGDILRIVDHVPIRIESSIILERIFSFTGHLYGLCDGRLYILTVDSYSNDNWVWEELNEVTSNIVNVSLTIDGQHIWLENQQAGYLYDQQWSLVEKKKHSTNGCYQRIYGPTRYHWLDFYPKQIICSNGTTYQPHRLAGFSPSGEVYFPESSDCFLYRHLSFRGEYVSFFIMERKCLPL